MKRCPECRRDYYDDSLLYCLDDGAHLLEGPASHEPATAILSGEAVTRQLSEDGLRAPNKRKKHLVASGLAIALLAAIGIGGFWLVGGRAGNSIESIAVLPFENASGDPNADYLSDGITESLINSLTELQNLKVIARTTAFRYKGKKVDALTAGRELKVGAVLTGIFRQTGDRLDLQVDLVDVSSGAQVWGMAYDRQIRDALGLKQAIAREVADKLRIRISGDAQRLLAKHDTQNADAYQFYLKARLYRNIGGPDAMNKALEQYQQAVTLDPNYALAHVGMADCYIWLGGYAGISRSEGLSNAKAAVQRALEIDESLADAHTTLSQIHDFEWRWRESMEEVRRAIVLNPNYPRAHQYLSNYLLYYQEFDEALSEAKKAQEIDPLSPGVTGIVALVYLVRNDLDSSIEESRKAIELEPRNPLTHIWLGWAYLKQHRYGEATAEFERGVELSNRQNSNLRDLAYCYAVTGRRAEALSILKEMEEGHAHGKVSGQQVAGVYAGLGDKDSAFAWLEKDFQQRGVGLANITYIRSFDDLRSDERYADLVRRLGLKP